MGVIDDWKECKKLSGVDFSFEKYYNSPWICY